jgi:hypothetical protein
MAMRRIALVWLGFFFYSLLVGILVQKVFLPYLFPSAHWGHGLMVGGDWIGFYQNALKVVEDIEEKGWLVWSLKPSVDGQIMTGITALFFAITGIHEPWIILPYNAFLHASAGVVLILILKEFCFGFKQSLIASIPLAVFPSSLTWVSQIHRDGLYILGFLLFFYSVVLALRDNTKKLLLSLPIGALGILLIYLGREHMMIPMKYLNFILFVLLLIVFLYKILKTKSIPHKVGHINFMFFLMFALLSHALAPQPQPQTQTQTNWKKEWWIPEKFDRLLYELARTRHYIIEHVMKGSAGAVDLDFMPQKASDFIVYTPRALLLGFFSPFPDVWFTKGGTPGGTLARYITPFETLIIWFGFFTFPFFLWKFRKRLDVYLIILSCILFVWLHVISEPNLGSIYRKRYVFVHTLIALSFANLLSQKRDKLEKA